MSNNNHKKDELSDKHLVDDDKLINFFCKLLEERKIEFINQIKEINLFNNDFEGLNKECYRHVVITNDVHSVKKECLTLSHVLKKFTNLDEKKDRAKLIRERKYVLQSLWPHFVRNAIKLLRQKDQRDKGELKFDFGVKNLTDYFEKFSEFEELLYGIDEYYRDHTLHTFRVYLLGEYVFRRIFKNGYDRLEIKGKPDEVIIDTSEKEAMWCLMALCHDLGYPLEIFDELNKKLLKILDFFGTSNFQRVRFSLPNEGAILDKFILKIVSSKLNKKRDNEYEVESQSKFYTKYANSYEKLNHGIMSCVLLVKNLVFFKETDYKKTFKEAVDNEDKDTDVDFMDDIKQYLIRREILRAIASHANPDIYHLQMNNFSFLLTAFDEIQEWNRPIAKKREHYQIEEKEKIYISEFNEKSIEISFALNITDGEIEKYQKIKFQKFIRLLRSAVDSFNRKFDFKMVIKNYNGTEYIFEYSNPDEHYEKKENKQQPYNRPTLKRKTNGKEDPDYSLDNILE